MNKFGDLLLGGGFCGGGNCDGGQCPPYLAQTNIEGYMKQEGCSIKNSINNDEGYYIDLGEYTEIGSFAKSVGSQNYLICENKNVAILILKYLKDDKINENYLDFITKDIILI